MIIQSLPVVEYNGATMADIFHPYNQYVEKLAQKYILQEYNIQGSPTPEQLSYKIYGDTNYYWLILYINKIYDPFWGWIRSSEEIYRYAEQKYSKVGGSEQVAYWRDEKQRNQFWRLKKHPDFDVWYDIGDEDYLYPQYEGKLYPVTRSQHEIQENEKKRRIKILPPSDLTKFLNELRTMLVSINKSQGNK